MKPSAKFDQGLIAPCGMNCAICSRYLAYKHDLQVKGIVVIPSCIGCRPRGRKCAFQKKCTLLRNGKLKYCYECASFPCERLEHLDQRYRKLYRMSMIDNLKSLKDNGISVFLEAQEKKWVCIVCGGTISCHNGICFDCGLDRLQNKKKIYRWEN
jgi:hypothetical protein